MKFKQRKTGTLHLNLISPRQPEHKMWQHRAANNPLKHLKTKNRPLIQQKHAVAHYPTATASAVIIHGIGDIVIAPLTMMMMLP